MAMSMGLLVNEGVLEAMVDVVLDQRFLGLLDGFFHRLQLLGNLQTLLPFFDHGNDTAQVPVGTLEALDQLGMAGVDVGFGGVVHGGQCLFIVSPPGGCHNPHYGGKQRLLSDDGYRLVSTPPTCRYATTHLGFSGSLCHC